MQERIHKHIKAAPSNIVEKKRTTQYSTHKLLLPRLSVIFENFLATNFCVYNASIKSNCFLPEQSQFNYYYMLNM